MARTRPSFATDPALGSPIPWIRRRLRGREDSEHEQALIRVGFAGFIAIYILLLPADTPDRAAVVAGGLWVSLVSLVASLLLVAHIVARPDVNPVRRLAGMVIDTIGLNALLFLGGMATAPFYPLLLWVILGHGFRFGRLYLLAAAATSVLLFAGVISFNREWREHPALGVALMIGLFVLPGYFAVLLGKLRVAIQRAEEASQAKSRFLATMSHEFRTPLNAVIGMADLLEDTRLDTDQRDMAVTIGGAGRSLLALVNDLLDIAKIEARRFAIEAEPFDLHHQLAAVRALLFYQAAEKGLHLGLRFDAATPRHLVGGARTLHQILVNLVANAIRFTEEGEIVIRVRPVRLPDDGEAALRFEVQDSGVGIPEAAQARIFERFTQADESTTRLYGGTGLGLSIVRELVDLMGGGIGVTSAPGRGSCFWFELPFARDPAAAALAEERLEGLVLVVGEPAAAAELVRRIGRLGPDARAAGDVATAAGLLRAAPGRRAILVAGRLDGGWWEWLAERRAERDSLPIDVIAVAAEPHGAWPNTLVDLPADADDRLLATYLHVALVRQDGGPARCQGGPRAIRRTRRPARVLVAEDNRTNRKVISRILERAGHEVELVGSGDEVVERLEQPDVDLVLMDINMPGMSGIDAMKLLRFMHPVGELPPVVVLSADVTAETRDACREIGFSAYLAKPIDSGQLLDTIEQLTAPREGTAAVPADGAGSLDTVVPLEMALPHPAGDTGRPVLDLRKLESLKALDNGDGFVVGVIDDFLSDAEEIGREIEAAFLAGDSRRLRDRGHALRSSAAHLGARALVELCLGWRELGDESLVLRGNAETVRLHRELARLRAALLDFRRTMEPDAPADDGRL
ncbi:MAG TPA: ATP-binding protein [Geminicoccaceae bacterium]|nr:ATP-binding protein [Geminicoccaceae bacterium]